MSDLVGNHIVGFPTRRLLLLADWNCRHTHSMIIEQIHVYEPPRGKTNNVDSEQV